MRFFLGLNVEKSIVLVGFSTALLLLVGGCLQEPAASPHRIVSGASTRGTTWAEALAAAETKTLTGTGKPQPNGLQNVPQGNNLGFWHLIDVAPDVTVLVFELDYDRNASAAVMTFYEPAGSEITTPAERLVIHRQKWTPFGPGPYKLEVFTRTDFPVDYVVTQRTIRTEPVPRQPIEIPFREPTEPGVVVAIIDTGINVYHETFRTSSNQIPGSFAKDTATGSSPLLSDITLSLDLEENRWQDEPLWRSMERRTLYSFPGTNILGISFAAGDSLRETYPVLDEHGHGTGTAATVLQVAPEATIVMIEVQIVPAVATGDADIRWSEVSDAVEWAAAQPWIDVISVSMGSKANAPASRIANGDLEHTLSMARAVERAVGNGKVYVNSAGNDPTFTWTDHPDGPPWSISVSGVEPTMRGRDVLAANGADFVANFTVEVPRHDAVNGTLWMQGTSFAAPRAAGAFAKAILEVRRVVGHLHGISEDRNLVVFGKSVLTNHDFRNAFNRTAVYWNTTDYDANRRVGGPYEWVLGASAPILATPWLQMGWGYVDDNVASQAAATLLGSWNVPEKPQAAKDYMQSQHDIRTSVWNALLGPRSESTRSVRSCLFIRNQATSNTTTAHLLRTSWSTHPDEAIIWMSTQHEIKTRLWSR